MQIKNIIKGDSIMNDFLAAFTNFIETFIGFIQDLVAKIRDFNDKN